ncbi:putative methyltransferase YqeM [Sporomusaceae bacterium FL31]|nr:putative methyltransferase YqeM [Sporomusaceae bacterium FL31]GCE33901.1 putative methyltransferase YqeM [Sporomusaceae bacterium]
MGIFGAYSQYYDLVYKDKNYAEEVDYVDSIIRKYKPDSKNILDLGCGTGRHAYLLSQKGYLVQGIDQSAEMLSVARNNWCNERISYVHGDVRTIRLGSKVDVVTSLFHVLSYQKTNQELEQYFLTVKEHLRPGGIFIVDCWYGPAVLSDRPVVRVKRLENDAISIVRIAEPTMYANENYVDVKYNIFIKNKQNSDICEFVETHSMRYLFKPELSLFFKMFGFKLLESKEWLTSKEPGFDTWGVCFVGSYEGK